MEVPILIINTLLLRPYVFLFLAAFLFSSRQLMGWRRTLLFLGITWLTAFLCEYSSTRTGFPFGWYHYTGSTVGEELYLSNVPFMDSLSFVFLLFASYCLALFLVLPVQRPSTSDPAVRWPALPFDPEFRRSWPVFGLSVLFFVFIDIIIDPVALRGERWFLGQVFYYPEPGIYFGVPLANFLGWAVVGGVSLVLFFLFDRRLQPLERRRGESVTGPLLLGCTLYYGVLIFNLTITFWIGEMLLGLVGLLIFLPVTALFLLRLLGRLSGFGVRATP